jgi:transcriptional regulator with XRE-family HTH domain
VHKSFGPYLRETRTAKGITQTELAAKLGVAQTTISAWELGVSEPSIARLRQIARALGVKVADLIDGEIAA